MQINLVYDSSVARAPASFATSLNQAVQFLDQTFASPITITIQVGWQEIEGQPLGSGDVGEGGPVNAQLVSYSQLKAALAANVNSAAVATAVANLPTFDPTSGHLYVASAEEKALGLISPTASGIDGAVGFQGDAGFGDIVHEITHAMGRVAYLGLPSNFNEFSVLDLYRYTGSGALNPRAVNNAYFSFDGGRTVVNTFANTSDLGDWAGATTDAFNAFGGPNDPVSTGDLEEMNVLGFALANPTVAGQTLTLASLPETVLGAGGDTIIGNVGTAIINATAGAQSVIGSAGAITVFGAARDTVVGGTGNMYVDATNGGVLIEIGSGGTGVIIGAVGNNGSKAVNTIVGGAAAVQIEGLGPGDIIGFASESGNATVNGTAGGIGMTFGSGAATIYAAAGDVIALGSGNQYVDGLLGGSQITMGTAGGNDIIIGSLARAAGAGGDTLLGGAAAVQVQGLGQGDVVSFANQSGAAIINATAGAIAATMGSGNATVYGGAGDAIALGGGNQYVDGTLGGSNIAVGTGGFDIIIGSLSRAAGTGVDTLIGGAAQVQVQGLGRGDVVSFAGQTGNASVNATAGNIAATLGGGAASVVAGAGDAITLGSVSQYVDARAAGGSGGSPGAVINLGAGGTDNIIGSTVAGGPGVTITGGAAALNYNTGFAGTGGDDFVNLTGGTGSAVINGFGFDNGAVNDTIIASNGGDSVWGGQGDRIGVGYGGSGTDLFTHASTINGASVSFGSADSVVATSYGNSAGAVAVNAAVAGRSAAQVTVTGFSESAGTPTDSIFYQNEAVATNTAIVTTSSQVSLFGLPSTQLTLPDGTVMTLLGVPKADFNTSFFR